MDDWVLVRYNLFTINRLMNFSIHFSGDVLYNVHHIETFTVMTFFIIKIYVIRRDYRM